MEVISNFFLGIALWGGSIIFALATIGIRGEFNPLGVLALLIAAFGPIVVGLNREETSFLHDIQPAAFLSVIVSLAGLMITSSQIASENQALQKDKREIARQEEEIARLEKENQRLSVVVSEKRHALTVAKDKLDEEREAFKNADYETIVKGQPDSGKLSTSGKVTIGKSSDSET